MQPRMVPELACCGVTVPSPLISGRYLFSSFVEFLLKTHNDLICCSGGSSWRKLQSIFKEHPDSRTLPRCLHYHTCTWPLNSLASVQPNMQSERLLSLASGRVVALAEMLESKFLLCGHFFVLRSFSRDDSPLPHCDLKNLQIAIKWYTLHSQRH